MKLVLENGNSFGAFNKDKKTMNHLLMPADERDLTEFLCAEIGALLLLSDVAPAGEPNIAKDPVKALPPELPNQPVYGSSDIFKLLFWLPHCGPVKTLSDAPEPDDVCEKVAHALTHDSAGGQYTDVIDTQRTPILSLRRSKWLTQKRVVPGGMGSMPLTRAAIPKEVNREYDKTIRWLKKHGVKVDPFSHCPEVESRRPKNLGPLWVWVQPHAMEIIKRGTEIWPWNG